MSAFIVGYDHIDALMTFATTHRVSYYVSQEQSNKPGGTRVTIETANATEIGRILLDENERSVRYRYDDAGPRDDLPGTIGENSESYRFRLFMDYTHRHRVVSVIKACSCFDYQACETPDYSESIAHSIIEAIRAAAIRALPNYDDVPGWDITRDRKAA